MAGLLDFLPEDKNERAAVLQGLLGAGFGMMQGARNPGGSFAPAFGAGGMQGMQAYQGAIEGQQARQMREMQMGEIKRKQTEAERQRAILERIGSQPIGDRTKLAQELIQAGQVDEGVKMLTAKPDLTIIPAGATAYEGGEAKYTAPFKPEKLPDWQNPEYLKYQKDLEKYKADLHPKASGGNSIGGDEQYGKLSPGFRRIKDKLTGTVVDEAIPGSAPYQKLKGQYAQETAAITNATADADTLIERSKTLQSHPGLKGVFGISGYFPSIKGGDAGQAEALLEEIKNSMQLAGFQQLRSSVGSPGAMTEKEWPKLEAAISQLQNSTDLAGAKQALRNIETYAQRIKNVSNTAYKNEWSGSQFKRELSGKENTQNEPRVVKSEAEAMMLPKGTEFVLNGRRGILE